jgi:molybdopterin-guanine dinucleotide biosynthesis adapter protein
MARVEHRVAHAMRIFGIAGFSGSGKTVLIERLLPLLRAHGIRVAVIKHAHHDFEVDLPGKDSWRHRRAGATEVLVSSATRWVLMHENSGSAEPSLMEQVGRISNCDLILVEGYKSAAIPKLEVHRAANGKPWLHVADANIAGIATDARPDASVPVFDLNNVEAIANFVLANALELKTFEDRRK